MFPVQHVLYENYTKTLQFFCILHSPFVCVGQPMHVLIAVGPVSTKHTSGPGQFGMNLTNVCICCVMTGAAVLIWITYYGYGNISKMNQNSLPTPKAETFVRGKDVSRILCRDSEPPGHHPTRDLNPKPSKFKGLFFLGCLDLSRNYSVFSIAVNNKTTGLDYQFYAPLTALAWNRVGFSSILVVCLPMENGSLPNSPLLNHVLSSTLEQGAFILLMVTEPMNVVTMSQVSRLTAPSIVGMLVPRAANVYMLTTDADLWPINISAYLMPSNMKIHSRNPLRSKQISMNNTTYTYYNFAFSFVGMRVKTWKQVLTTSKGNSLPTNVSGLIKFLNQEIGNVTLTNDRRAGHGWFTDQKILSHLLNEWMYTYGEDKFHFNQVRGHRLDRIGWKPRTLEGLTDAHLVANPSSNSTWNLQLLPLLGLMYGHSVKDMLFCLNYFHTFQVLQKPSC